MRSTRPAREAPPQGRYYREYAGAAGHPYENAEGYADFAENNDVFAELCAAAAAGAKQAARARRGPALRVARPFPRRVNGGGAEDHPAVPRNARRDDPGRRRRRPGPAPARQGRAPARREPAATRWCRSSSNRTTSSPVRRRHPGRAADHGEGSRARGEVRTPTTTGSVMLKIPHPRRTGDTLASGRA